MRLIDTETGEFVEFFHLSTTPPYAILSHTWEPTGEQTYQEVIKIQEKYRRWSRLGDPEYALNVLAWWGLRTPAQSILPVSHEFLRSYSIFVGFLPLWWWAFIDLILRAWLSLSCRSVFDPDSGLSEKVRRACKIARQNGYRYIWIDSCCINKTSSSELSEAINSMFNWYRAAQICYAFLVDVPSSQDVRAEGSDFRKSRWFKRGWTLQELIAPPVVVFLSRDWESIGTKGALADLIQDITFVDRGILTRERELSDESVAERMRWASVRTTTRVEDEAYSLLGIFGITMPTLYGEGRYAFRRLQEEILRWIPDQSLFVWGSLCTSIPQEPSTLFVDMAASGTLFAPSPQSFASHRGRTIPVTGYSLKSFRALVEEYAHSPYGIRAQFCLLPLQALTPELDILELGTETTPPAVPWYLIVFSYQHADHPRHLLGKLGYLRRDKSHVEFLHLPDRVDLDVTLTLAGQLDRRIESVDSLIYTIPLDDLAPVIETQLLVKTVYLPHPKPSESMITRRLPGESTPVHLTHPEWNRAALRMLGYTVSPNTRCLAGHSSDSPSFTLSYASISVHIDYRYRFVNSRSSCAVIIQARIWLSESESPLPQTNILKSDAAAQAVHSTPPYASVIWVDGELWAMTPTQNVDLIAQSGKRARLRLGLDSAGISRYSIRVEVAPDDPAPVGVPLLPRADFKDFPGILRTPKDTFELILPGSVQRALEMKGYSVHLETGPSVGGFPSYSLTLSGVTDFGFVVIIKYFHRLGYLDTESGPRQELEVAARVSLESSTLHRDTGSTETYQDGPHVAIWMDTMAAGWAWSLKIKHVLLTTPTGAPLTLHLGFDFAWHSEYHLHIDVEPGTGPGSRYPEILTRWNRRLERLTGALGSAVTLTLPGHVRRGLQTQGYQAHFEELNGEGNSARHRLVLTNIDAGFVITVVYSHDLTTDFSHPNSTSSPESEPGSLLLAGPKAGGRHQQELVFRACIEVFPSCGFEDGARTASQGHGMIVHWDARDLLGGWRRDLHRKDLTLALPAGRQLTLHLGFYFVWYSEYCLLVDVERTQASVIPAVSTQFVTHAPSRLDRTRG